MNIWGNSVTPVSVKISPGNYSVGSPKDYFVWD